MKRSAPPDYYNSAELDRWLERITYRPGVSMRIAHPEFLGEYSYPVTPTLQLCADVENTYRPGQRIEIIHQTLIPQYVIETEQTFQAFVRQALINMEMHELDEWFKIDGVMVNDPHAANRFGF